MCKESDSEGQRFLVVALHNLRRTVALATIGVGATTILLWLIIDVFLPHVFNSISAHIDQVSFVPGTSTIVLRQKRVEWYTLSVPAAQLNVPTGITLNPDKHYDIRATGAVSTAKGVPALPRSLSKETSLSNEELKNLNAAWRGPDGELLYYTFDPNPETNCVATKSSRLRLDPNANYGELLALIVKDGESPDYRAFKKKEKSNFIVVRVGKGATLTYKENEHHFVVSDQHDPLERDFQKLDASYLGNTPGQLYLQVNDTVITDPEDFSLEGCQANATEQKWRDYSRKLYTALLSNPQDPSGTRVAMAPGVWYLDNDGSFTVSIIAREGGK